MMIYKRLVKKLIKILSNVLLDHPITTRLLCFFLGKDVEKLIPFPEEDVAANAQVLLAIGDIGRATDAGFTLSRS